MDQGWRSPLGLGIVGGLVVFGALSVIAALERRGLTWWDPVIIGGVVVLLWGAARWRGRRS